MFKKLELNQQLIVYLGDYHKYRLSNGVNPNFDPFSKRILDLKIDLSAFEINKFAKQIDNLIDDNIAICYVPSCDSNKNDSGVRRLAVRISELALHRTDATECIIRHTSIDKLAKGGRRHIQVHLNSLSIKNPKLIKGQRVLVIDDVTTSHNSLFACKQLLLEAGAAEVYCLALGQTVPE